MCTIESCRRFERGAGEISEFTIFVSLSRKYMGTILKLESNGTSITLVIEDRSNNADQLADIGKLVSTISAELAGAPQALGPEQRAAIEEAVGKLQTHLASPNPDSSVIKGILSSVRSILEEAAGGILADNWLTILTFLKSIIGIVK
jgi:hypothetical protein